MTIRSIPVQNAFIMEAFQSTGSSTREPRESAEHPGGVGGRQRERIIRAATLVFSRKGYDGARVEEIARKADLPKGNVLYYFKTKKDLYRIVIEQVLTLWLDALGDIAVDDSPEEAIRQYVNRKLALSRHYPEASRLFAMEVISGAPVIGAHLRNQLRVWVEEKGRVFRRWQDQGQMARIDPAHAFFMIWAVTQTYADFEAQIQAVTGVQDYDTEIYEGATSEVVDALVRGLGLTNEMSERRAQA
ncbi:MAG: TetR/AcrR family transcriptional regulator [Arenicellales bacterium]|nr:TetR/AcrR family transcriptional regulator [Arenicellales bacterium]MDP6551302.1 TetR/AcrR family transcriptional regulator [Arenicellales bacterium]MDP6791438.1 TetR/AcrR family transcriptional regulator [Arenicellales bacterium]MDP6919499.1 TetR/AcrR family transcriptional regulator [Arenicellales bacterium]